MELKRANKKFVKIYVIYVINGNIRNPGIYFPWLFISWIKHDSCRAKNRTSSHVPLLILQEGSRNTHFCAPAGFA
jgi:hypothetical protein